MIDENLRATPVRVSLPASVAADIGSLKKAVGSILDKLGCPACCSGHDILFELQRDVVLQGKISDRARVFASSNSIKRSGALQNIPTVRVGITPAAVNKIEGVYAAIERVAELSGHVACATGCDMRFQQERIFVMDERLGVDEQVMTLG